MKPIIAAVLATALICGAVLITSLRPSDAVSLHADDSSPNATSKPVAGNEQDGAKQIANSDQPNLSAGELYDRGVINLKLGRREKAYRLFKAAYDSRQWLDPVRARRLDDYLRELVGKTSDDQSKPESDSRVASAPVRAHGADAVINSNDVQDEKEVAFDHESKELAKQLRSAAPAERQQLQQSLRRLIERHFEYRQSQRTAEIARLNERLQALKLTTARRGENRSEVIDRRFKDLIDPNTDLNWNEPDANEDVRTNNSNKSSHRRSSDQANSTELPRKSSIVEPTFKEMTLSKWLGVLHAERSPEKLSEALEAIRYLAGEADPRTLVRAILDMNRSRTQVNLTSRMRAGSTSPEQSVTTRSVGLLFVPKPEEIVVDELVKDLNDCVQHGPNTGFQILFREFANALASYLRRQRGVGVFQYSNISKDSVDGLCNQMRRRSLHSGQYLSIASALAKIAEKDASQRDWVVECGSDVIEIFGEPLSTFPMMIPVFESTFRNAQSEQRITAAAALSQSGLDIAEVLEFLETKLNAIPLNVLLTGNTSQVQELSACLAELYPHSPLEVIRVANRWKESTGKQDIAAVQADRLRFKALVVALGGIGEAGKNLVPYLRTIEQAPEFHGDLQRTAIEAIKTIESAKPRPKPEPLPEEDSVVESAPVDEGLAGRSRSSAPEKEPTIARDETTFDGVPYAQWRKLLETERKPDKLATAIEACGRLAEPRDQRRIARGILHAAQLFESGNPDETGRVWAACYAALDRFAADSVIDEMIAAFKDEDSYRAGRAFQGDFFLIKDSEEIKEASKKRAGDLIGAMQKAISIGGKGTENVLAAASNVWRDSGRPLNDFEILKSQMLNAISVPPTVNVQRFPEDLLWTWKTVASNLVEKAPDTEGLLALLMKHSEASTEVVGLVGKLGRRAKSAVPQLLDQFVPLWKECENDRLERASAGGGRGNAKKHNESQLRLARCAQIVTTLGEIGVGAQGYELLKELNLTAPPAAERQQLPEGKVFEAALRGLKNFDPPPQSVAPSNVLNDGSLINGQWKLLAIAPVDSRQNISIAVGLSKFVWRDAEGRAAFSTAFVLDDAQVPKQITLIDSASPDGNGKLMNLISRRMVQPDDAVKMGDRLVVVYEKKNYVVEVLEVEGRGKVKIRWVETGEVENGVQQTSLYYPNALTVLSKSRNSKVNDLRMPGIYELTDTTLRIQLAQSGDVRPTELVSEKAKLPEGQILLEFERKLDE